LPGGGTDTNGLVFELTQKQLLKLKNGEGVNAAKVEFEDPYDFDCPSSLEFDQGGNLWVLNTGTNYGSPSIIEYSADQLARGGTVAPAVVCKSADFHYLWDIKFDSAGNLWIAADAVPGGNPAGVYELSAAQLAETGLPPVMVTPNLELTSAGFNFPGPIQFDQGGNLWVGGLMSPVLSFAAGDLIGSGTISPSPMVTIDPVTVKKINSSFYDSSGLAFDDQGDLWVGSGEGAPGAKQMSGSIAEFKSGQIATSGSPKPSLFFLTVGIVKDPGHLTFGPLL